MDAFAAEDNRWIGSPHRTSDRRDQKTGRKIGIFLFLFFWNFANVKQNRELSSVFFYETFGLKLKFNPNNMNFYFYFNLFLFEIV